MRYPILICLEAGAHRDPDPEKVQSQTTTVKLLQSQEGSYYALPIKQRVQVGSDQYELMEIFGIDQSLAGNAASGGEGKRVESARECVICMTAPRDTAVLPCRHMCMCSDCARQLRSHSNKCPICRTAIQQLLQIKARL